MFKRIACIAYGFGVLALLIGIAVAQTTHNDNATMGYINCNECHFLHGGSAIPRGAAQEGVCKSCHTPGNPDAGHLSDITNHTVDGGATTIDCGSCHDVHNDYDDPQTQNNLSYIRGNTGKYVADALEPAQFEADPAGFANSSAPYNAICQTCHTSITRHTNDGLINHNPGQPADNAHGPVGANCISCHGHLDGFAGSGGTCIDCHATPQPSVNPTRRAIVAEFDQTSHHVMAGNGATITEGDCQVCHMEVFGESLHANSNIDLRDPDTGTALTGFTTFTSANYTYVQNNLCLKCHDQLGAVYFSPDNLIPFSADDRNVPNVFDALDTANSFYHPVRGAGTNTFCNATTMVSGYDNAILTCFDCHTANGHGASNQRMVVDAIDFNTMVATAPIDSGNLPVGMGATVQNFCTRCHNSSVYVSGNLGSIYEDHDQGQHTAAGGNELGCMGCHGGTVNFAGEVGRRPPVPIDNGSAPGNIHGGDFTWSSPSASAGAATDTFMLGGWISGWNSSGQCWGGMCNHGPAGNGQSYTRVAD